MRHKNGQPTYDDFVDQLVYQDEIGAEIIFFETATEIVNPPNNGLKKFQRHGRDNVPTGRGEHEKQLIPFYVRKLDALALLNSIH